MHRKTALLESLFNLEYCEIFKSTYFEEHLWTAASEWNGLFLFHDWFPLEFAFRYNISQRRSQDLDRPLQDIVQNFDNDVIITTLTSLSWRQGKHEKL